MLPAKRMSEQKRVINDDDEDEDQYQTLPEQPPSKLQKVVDADKSAGKVPAASNAERAEDSSDSDEEGEGGKKRIKWRKLEHHGVIFFPPYKPHGVKLLHKGKPVDLT